MSEENKEVKEQNKKDFKQGVADKMANRKETIDQRKEKMEQLRAERKEDRIQEREDIREGFQQGREELKTVIATTIDPNGDKDISLGEIFGEMFSIHKDVASKKQIDINMREGGKVSGTNMCLLVLAMLIASIGLNVNSTAVIIGAMLISPLMGTIQAAAYGTATADFRLTVRSVMGFAAQVIISIFASTIYFLISPLGTQTSELLARTQPTVWDALIAICGGLAGIIGVTRKQKTNVIPGVAIATALMPPLCTCGYSIAHGQWKMLLGAGYLFALNTYFIFLTASIILLILGVPKVKEVDAKKSRRLKRALIRNSIIILIPSIVFAYFMVKDKKMEEKASIRMENAIDIVALNDEIKVLFPDVEEVTLGVISKASEAGEEVEHKAINITYHSTEENLDTNTNQDSSLSLIEDIQSKPIMEEQDRLVEWLQTRYPDYMICIK